MCKMADSVVPIDMNGGGRTIPRDTVWEATGQPDNSYLVESGQIMKFRVGAKIEEDDDSDRFYFS